MLPQASRVRHPQEFSTTIRTGRRIARRSFLLYAKPRDLAPGEDSLPGYSPSTESYAQRSTDPATDHLSWPSVEGGAGSRAGLIVSKQVGGAVVRNRVKRRLRHLVAPRLATLSVPTDIVIRALPASATEPQRLSRDIATAWEDLTHFLADGTLQATATAGRSGR
ncbi:MAG: ribonuclease P protein component [Propionibacteriaceae bacterium]|jgi:ribonuclease P protein component|nr:ribonuclease P protein component [Propionibacteriaceae bacterium]